MSEKVYSVVNVYDYGRGMAEYATFTDYSSAVQFARACAIPEDYNGYLEVLRYSKGQSFYFGDQLFKIMPNGEEFEAEGDK